MQPKLFKVKPGSFREIKNRVLSIFIPVILVATITGTVIARFYAAPKPGDNSALYLVIPVMLMMAVYRIYRTLKKQKELFESFSLIIDEGSVVREQKHTAHLTIKHSDIKKIVKHKNGSISIKTGHSFNCICVPAQIENYDQMEAALNEIKPVEKKTSASLTQLYNTALALLVLGLMAWIFLTNNKPVIVVGGIVLTGVLAWCTYVCWKSGNLDQRAKKGLLWMIVIFTAIISRIVMAFLYF